MTIRAVYEKFEGRKGEFQVDHGQRTYTRVFHVVTSSPTIDSDVVASASYGGVFVPALLSAHPVDSGALCKSITPVAMGEDYTQWIVTCEYDSRFPVPEFQNKDPLSRPPKWVFGVTKYTRALQVDQLGNPFVNSCCMPFDPPFEIEESRPTIEITIGVATFNYPYLTTVSNAINSDSWFGFAPFQVKCDSAVATQMWENAITFWELKYNLTVKWDGWHPVLVLDQGLYERGTGSASGASSSSSGGPCPTQCQLPIKLIRDGIGTPVAQPVLLDGAGHKSNCPVYLDFYPYRMIPFSGNIP